MNTFIIAFFIVLNIATLAIFKFFPRTKDDGPLKTIMSVTGIVISIGSIFLPLVLDVTPEMMYPVLPLAVATLCGSIMIGHGISLFQLAKFLTLYIGGLFVAGAALLSFWMFPYDVEHTILDYAFQISPVLAAVSLMAIMYLFYHYAFGEINVKEAVIRDKKQLFLLLIGFTFCIGLGSIFMQNFSPAILTVPFGVGIGIYLMMKGKAYHSSLSM